MILRTFPDFLNSEVTTGTVAKELSEAVKRSVQHSVGPTSIKWTNTIPRLCKVRQDLFTEIVQQILSSWRVKYFRHRVLRSSRDDGGVGVFVCAGRGW